MLQENLNYIKNYLKENNIDAYVVFSSDDHGSEYVVDYYKAREFLSGFTGSAGTLIITQTDSYLFTDGRYFLQAEEQLKASGAKLMKMGEEGVPTVIEFLSAMSSTLRVALDLSIATANFVKSLIKASPAVTFIDNGSIIDELWNNRPALPDSKAYVIDTKNAGESTRSKIARLRAEMAKNNTKVCLLASLDDIAWLFNIRGNDIPCNPVNLAYAIVKENLCILYVNKKKITSKVEAILNSDDIFVKDYNKVYEDVSDIEDAILYDEGKTNYKLVSLLKKKVALDMLPTTKFKAVKNETEIKNIKKAHVYDGVAMCKFMYYLKTNKHLNKETEMSVTEVLFNLRKQQKGFVNLSFDTICGYEAHGAIIHYEATKETDIPLANKGLLLVDSGGQYKYGTTDITRTFALGKITKKEKTYFTYVLKGHIDLASVTFLKGVSGSTLDMLTRKPLWDNLLNYNHGTGHGVGYMLNVHEGPQRINFGPSNYKFEVGMLTSNEPGIYIPNEFGVRHENLVICKEVAKNSFGTFYGFDTVTLVPFDLDAIDVSLLTAEEKKWLNNYHKEVYKKISPYLNDKEAKFLANATREI